MPEYQIDSYTQSLLNRIISLSKEVDNLHAAYIIVKARLNHLSIATEQNCRELIEEALKVEKIAHLALEASKLTEQSALMTNNPAVIDAAKKSTVAAMNVHRLTGELKANSIAKLKNG